MKKYLLLILFPFCVDATSPTIAQIEKAMQQGNLAQVEQMSKEAVQEHPKSAKAHYFLGQAYFNENKIVKANVEFMAARKLDPNLNFTKKPEMFNDMLNRSSVKLSAVTASASVQVAKPKTKKSDSLNIIWLIIGASLGLALGALILAPVIKKPRKIESDLGPEFELEDEDMWKSTTSHKADFPKRMPILVTPKYTDSISPFEELRKPIPNSINNIKRPSSVTRISNIRRTTPEHNSLSAQQSTVIRESNNGSSDLLTGVFIGNMLSNHHHETNIMNENTTIVNNYSNDNENSSSLMFDSSSDTSSWSDDTGTKSWDTSGDQSWGGGGETSFDSSTSNDNW
ncbi:MAG TPA: hypothetical protein PLP75_01605 [Burkholderiales bacterium]|nr:hypothetical protein [Burkholderiales bacterium]